MKIDAVEIAVLVVTLAACACFVYVVMNAKPAPCIDGKRHTVSIIGKVIINRYVDCTAEEQ